MNKNYTIKNFMDELAKVWQSFSDDGQAFLSSRIAGERFSQELNELAKRYEIKDIEDI